MARWSMSEGARSRRAQSRRGSQGTAGSSSTSNGALASKYELARNDGLRPGEAVPVRRPRPLGPLEPGIRFFRIRRVLLRARAVARGELGCRVMELLVRSPRAGHQDHGRSIAGAHEDMLGSGGTVEEVPRPEEPLLAVDEQPALPRQHEERLLLRLGVIEAVRLARLQDAEVDAELRERHVLTLESAARAEGARQPPLGVPHVDDEPALAGGGEAGAGIVEPRLEHGARIRPPPLPPTAVRRGAAPPCL